MAVSRAVGEEEEEQEKEEQGARLLPRCCRYLAVGCHWRGRAHPIAFPVGSGRAQPLSVCLQGPAEPGTAQLLTG